MIKSIKNIKKEAGKIKRLDVILSLLPAGCRLADIGCDHAYIPISALKTGKAAFAYASDVREGPLSRAEKNVCAAGLSGKTVLKLANGLDGAEEYSPDTIVIAGMGGELIAEIIGRAPFVKTDKITLILQPMTCADELRGYLLSNGFEILRERLAYEERHIYQIIVCRFTNKAQKYSEAELEVGKDHEDKELVPALYKKYTAKYEKIIKGKTKAGMDAQKERAILNELREKYENFKPL